MVLHCYTLDSWALRVATLYTLVGGYVMMEPAASLMWAPCTDQQQHSLQLCLIVVRRAFTTVAFSLLLGVMGCLPFFFTLLPLHAQYAAASVFFYLWMAVWLGFGKMLGLIQN
jgi:hypothetical protein